MAAVGVRGPESCHAVRVLEDFGPAGNHARLHLVTNAGTVSERRATEAAATPVVRLYALATANGLFAWGAPVHSQMPTS